MQYAGDGSDLEVLAHYMAAVVEGSSSQAFTQRICFTLSPWCACNRCNCILLSSGMCAVDGAGQSGCAG